MHPARTRTDGASGRREWTACRRACAQVRRLLDGADYFASDGMHPNDAGYAVWADIIAERVLSELRLQLPRS